MTTYDWPSNLSPRGIAFDGRGMTVSGPRSLTGRAQVASVDAGYWIATYTQMPVGGPDRVRAFRALRALLEGGAHSIRVPVFDRDQAPWPGSTTYILPIPHSDGAYFSGGSGYSQRVITGTVYVAGTLRDTSIWLQFTNLGEIRGGEYFSLGDRLYLVRQVLTVSGALRQLAIWPPLREAVAAGIEPDFDRPTCLMRLADETAADLTLERGIYGYPDMAFVEVI